MEIKNGTEKSLRHRVQDSGSKAGKTDITEIPIKDEKLYVSTIFDCYDLGVLGLAMSDNMRAELCVSTIKNASRSFPSIRGAIIHSDRWSQYTSELYRNELQHYGLIQSMNSDGR